MEGNGLHLRHADGIMRCIKDILSLTEAVNSSKGDIVMEKANRSIHCTVTSCQNHCSCEDYCSLDSVQIGTHECNPKKDQCTDCMSFRKKA